MNRFAIKKLKPNPLSVAARLPEVYTKFVKELKKQPSPVHYIPESGHWKVHPIQKRSYTVENVPLPLKYPKEFHEGLWGGEAVIQGFIKKKPKRRRFPNFWVPQLKKSIVYSEILNKYMAVTVTERTLELIDKHSGFDNYILETPVQDLRSQLALDLRRRMLLSLIDKERNYEDDDEQMEVWNKYKHFEIPREEAEWFGLSEKEAIKKQKLLEEETSKPEPLKHALRKAYIEELKTQKQKLEEKSTASSLLSKVPFMKGKTQ